MEPKIWMINKSGSSKYVSLHIRDKLIADGWLIIPPDKLDTAGKPKQLYWPQYDENNPAREKRIIPSEVEDPKNVLKIEPF